MSAVLAPLRLRGPGFAWVPAVLRERITWRTVWRFTWAGPLIGGLPYVWMLFTIPFAYAIGVVPAALAGLLFAAWYHGHTGRVPTWPWRAAVGALAGMGAVALTGLATVLFGRSFDAFWMAVWTLHGVPAAVALGLLQKPARAAAHRPLPSPAPKPLHATQRTGNWRSPRCVLLESSGAKPLPGDVNSPKVHRISSLALRQDAQE